MADEALSKAIRDDILKEVSFKVHREIVETCPVDSGRLRESIVIEKDGEDSFRIGTDVEYASGVENGTVPHIIVPKEKKALRWKGPDGKFRFAKKVHHPGTAGHHFFMRAAAKIPRFIREAIEKRT